MTWNMMSAMCGIEPCAWGHAPRTYRSGRWPLEGACAHVHGAKPHARMHGTMPHARMHGAMTLARMHGAMPLARMHGAMPLARIHGTMSHACMASGLWPLDASPAWSANGATYASRGATRHAKAPNAPFSWSAEGATDTRVVQRASRKECLAHATLTPREGQPLHAQR
jgi:hypothetical protein